MRQRIRKIEPVFVNNQRVEREPKLTIDERIIGSLANLYPDISYQDVRKCYIKQGCNVINTQIALSLCKS